MINKILYITLKKKWFDMTSAGIKKEEYREIKPYWCARLLLYDGKKMSQQFWDEYISERQGLSQVDLLLPRINSVPYTKVEAKNGYGKLNPTIQYVPMGLRIGEPEPDWCEPGDIGRNVFILSIGDITGYGNGKFPF